MVKDLAQGCAEIKGQSGDLDEAARLLSTTTGFLSHPSSGLKQPSSKPFVLSPWELTSPLPAWSHSSLRPLASQTTGTHAQPFPSPWGFPPLLSAPFLMISPLLAPPLSKQICSGLSYVQLHRHPNKSCPLALTLSSRYCDSFSFHSQPSF